MKHILSAVLGGIAVAAMCVTFAAADPVADALRRGDPEAARSALNERLAGRKDAGLHRAHLEGLIALRQGNPQTAARIFEAILEAAPGFEPARLELARTLDVMGRRGPAIAQARRLAATTEDERLRDQLLSQIALADGARRGGVALRFSLLPSTNITGGTLQETVLVGGVPFTLDPTSREASGVGLLVGATAWHSWSLGKDWKAVASASVDQRIYDTALKPDETEVGLRLDMAHRGPRGGISFGPRFAVLFQNGDRARRQMGLGMNLSYLIDPRLRFTLAAEWLKQDHPQSAFRDGNRVTATPGLQWAVSRQTTLAVEMPLLRETANASHLAHKDIGLGFGFATQMRNGLNLGVNLFAGRNTYDGIYPGFDMARKDQVKSLRVGISHNRLHWKGLRPEFSVTRKWQSSNIPLHDTSTTDFGLSLSRRF